MTKGGRFEAFYNEKTNMWSDDIIELCLQIDEKLENEEHRVNEVFNGYKYIPISISSTHKWDDFVKYVKNLNDKFQTLDPKITFADQETCREDYVMHKLDYVMAPGDCSAWHTLVGRLYNEEDKRKIEWAIGALISGDSRKIQKCIFIEGQPGKGKSTIFEIMQNMFPYYYTAFKAESLGNENDKFALSAFAKNPLFAIDADAKLANMTATNRMNQVIGHDKMCVEEKFKAPYTMRITTMLFMASNYKMNITSSQSGMMRRTILIKPTEDTFPRNEYDELMHRITFEYGAICYHCLQTYMEMGPAYYENYRDKRLIGESNDLYNFLKDNYIELMSEKYVTVNALWVKFRAFLEHNNTVQIQHRKIDFENDIKNYFDSYYDRKYGAYKVLEGFKTDLFEFSIYDEPQDEQVNDNELPAWLYLRDDIPVKENILNKWYSDCLAQEANDADHPKEKWDNVKTSLKDIDTSKVHYVLPPEKHIVIDFDLKDAEGNKNLNLNLEAAKIFPETYVEISKGGQGLHLHYIYDGDIDELASLFAEHIEIISFKGKRALRRRLSMCNDHDIAVLKEGQLPKKEVKEVAINGDIVITEQGIRKTIAKCLLKQVHADSTSNINLIEKCLEDAYASGIDYDVSDLKQKVLTFAQNSSKTRRGDLSNIKKVNAMHFRCKRFEEELNNPGYGSEPVPFEEDAPIVFFDIEIFSNLFLICWKTEKMDEPIAMINPTPSEVQNLFKYKLIGFNNRKYDNHLLYARSMGYSTEALFKLSNTIINGDTAQKLEAGFMEAYNLSYTDVYDFASAANKMGLKKWEIKLGIHHLENEFPWNEPLPEDKWDEIIEYCKNDVKATEAVFNHLSGDFAARKILAKLTGLTVNHTTNQLTTKLLIGDEKNPKSQYVYTDLSKEFPGYKHHYNDGGLFDISEYDEGAKIVNRKDWYRGEDATRGGYKIGFPGYYENVGLLDSQSHHPTSAIMLNIFGDKITQRFKNLLDGRLAAKHIKEVGDDNYKKAIELLGPVIEEYFNEGLEAGESVKYLAKNLSNALKTAINSVYGLTSASFDNKLKDPRNVDNIVAKRGSLFMINLKHEILDRGWDLVHISTDSVKIANITPEIIQFVQDYGHKYGYDFLHEATYGKMCLVNDAVFIARIDEEDGQPCEPHWEATGKEFQVPYIFKTLFSHEEVTFDDLCIIFQSTSALYLASENIDGSKTYRFVGKVGNFVPVKSECAYACELLRLESDGRYSAASGTKGYLWANAEEIKLMYEDPMSVVDMSYFENMTNNAIDDIEKYVPFDELIRG